MIDCGKKGSIRRNDDTARDHQSGLYVWLRADGEKIYLYTNILAVDHADSASEHRDPQRNRGTALQFTAIALTI